MANIDKLLPFILKWEGGFVNDKDDLGGAIAETICVFNSIKEAQRKTGIEKANISAAARHKTRWVGDHYATIRTAGGFIWKFI